MVKEKIIKFEEAIEKHLFANGSLEESRKLFCEKCFECKEFDDFAKQIPSIKEALEADLDFFMESDPACDSKEEVIDCYPGFKAIMVHRIAHVLADMGLRYQARVLSEHAHYLTGIDIHPAATIGHPFFIDHGTGIVIGETAIVGNRVKVYQGVTLGALSLGKGHLLKGTKRHPTVGNNVTIYSNASILGGDTVIGNNVVIGSNVFLLESVPDNRKVVLQKPELIVLEK